MPTGPRERSRVQKISHGAALDGDIPDPAIGVIYGVLDQAIHLRETMVRIADPFLLTLTDMLLFELGRRLARLEDERSVDRPIEMGAGSPRPRSA